MANDTTEKKAPEATAQKPTKRNDAQKKNEKKEKAPLTPEQKQKRTQAAIAAGLLVVGGLAGAGIHALLVPGAATSLTGATTVSENQLSDTVGTYTLNGRTHNVSAREALIAAGALTTNDSDSYDAPTAEDVLTVARNAAMSNAADERGITASEDEITQYLTDTFGTDDMAAAAEVYGYTEDELRSLIESSIKNQKLYIEVTDNEGGVGSAPTAPEDGLEGGDAAAYIIEVAGNAWDAEAGAWADGESEMAQAVGDFDGETATYEQAEAAYQVAYQTWNTRLTEVVDLWSDFCDETYKDVTVTCATANSNS